MIPKTNLGKLCRSAKERRGLLGVCLRNTPTLRLSAVRSSDGGRNQLLISVSLQLQVAVHLRPVQNLHESTISTSHTVTSTTITSTGAHPCDIALP